jgi:hypothetical protein
MILLEAPYLMQFQSYPYDQSMVIHPIRSLIVEGGKVDAGLLAEWQRILAIVPLARSVFHGILGGKSDIYNLWKHYTLVITPISKRKQYAFI